MTLAQWTTSIDVGGYELLLGTGGTNLGTTKEGSVLRINMKTTPLYVHNHGDTPYEIRKTGYEVELEAILLQKDADNLASILGGVKTTDAGPPSSTVVDVNPMPAKITGQKLELRPFGAADNSNSITIWSTAPVPNCEVAFKINEQQAFRVRFIGMIDENSSGAIRLLRFGDPDTLASTKSYFPQT